MSFTNEVVSIFESAFEVEIQYHRLGGTLDPDEQTADLGAMLTTAINRNPRVKFFTHPHGPPTVFWFVVKRKWGSLDDNFCEL